MLVVIISSCNDLMYMAYMPGFDMYLYSLFIDSPSQGRKNNYSTQNNHILLVIFGENELICHTLQKHLLSRVKDIM